MSSGHFYHTYGLPSAKADVSSLAGYISTRMLLPCQGVAMPPQFQLAEACLQRDTSPQKPLPLDILEQRAQTPCKHFEHHLGWCPYGMNCHLCVAY